MSDLEEEDDMYDLAGKGASSSRSRQEDTREPVVEDGEASDSDDDDEEDDDDDDEFDDGYGHDLIGDEDDRQYIHSLSEMDREQVLAERFEMRKRLETRRKLKAKQRERKREEKARGRRSKRRVVPQEKTKRKDTAMAALKAKRDRRADRADRRSPSPEPEDDDDEYDDRRDDDRDRDRDYDYDDRGRERGRDHRDHDRDRDRDRDREDRGDHREWDDVEVMEDPHKDRPIGKLEELKRLQVRRISLEKWIEEPFFEEVAVGMYVRIGIGVNDNRRVYRVAEIVEVREGHKKYVLGKKETNKLLTVQHGSSTKNFRMEFVSNESFTESEFGKWMQVQTEQRAHVPTPREIDQLLKRIRDAESYTYSNEDVDRMVLHKKKLRDNEPKNFGAAKTKLSLTMSMTHDVVEKERLQKEMEALQTLDEARNKKGTKQVLTINLKSDLRNQEADRDRAKIEAALNEQMGEKKKGTDPFSRRKTQPLLMDGTRKPSLPAEEEKKEKKVTKRANHDHEEQLKQAHSVELNLNIDVTNLGGSQGSKRSSLGAAGVGAKRAAPKRKTLSLADYKRRRGLDVE